MNQLGQCPRFFKKYPIVSADLGELQLELPTGFWNAPLVLVAVSGGSDSLALLHALLEQRQRLGQDQPAPKMVGFHFDHQWQAPSAEVARWVTEELQVFGVETIVRRRLETTIAGRDQARSLQADDAKAGEPQASDPEGIGPQSEGVARAQRYAAMAEVADSSGATYALTGHTRDDQAETVLMRIARGTGLAGLAGIPQQRRLSDRCQLWRPLLHLSRQRLRDYLRDRAIEFRDDPTNADPRWTRNRVRQSVLPWLQQNLSPEINESLVRLARLAGEHHEVVQCLAELHRGAILECGHGQLIIDVRQWSQLLESVVRTLLVYWWGQAGFPQREMDFEQWRRLTALASRPGDGETPNRWPSQWHFPGQIVAQRSGGVLRIVTPTK